MKIKKIKIESNSTPESIEVRLDVEKKIKEYEFSLVDTEPDLVIAIGGDGTFIQAVHNTLLSENSFTNKSPLFIGIHTGHLGFLQEIDKNEIDDFFQIILQDRFRIERVCLEDVRVFTKDGVIDLFALNEMTIRHSELRTLYLDVTINDKNLEHFAGDGLIISTPIGSTGYNLSAFGSIIFPSLNTIQIMPLAPIFSQAYKSLRNGVVVPEDMTVSLIPHENYKDKIALFIDGNREDFPYIEKIDITASRRRIEILRLDKYDFWTRVKEKFL
jgi:NAD+ kinase